MDILHHGAIDGVTGSCRRRGHRSVLMCWCACAWVASAMRLSTAAVDNLDGVWKHPALAEPASRKADTQSKTQNTR